jgi:site-specific DNA-methyltransferase (adenine-specific)
MAKLPAACLDAAIADPPYAIAIGGEAWDRFTHGETTPGVNFQRWTRSWASEALRALKPGAHVLAFGAPRTFHRLAAGIEDAGFEIRDVMLWLYAQGLPKSQRLPGGHGTALKPAYEPILLARKPLTGTTTGNLAAHGTGALNIDAARVGEHRFWPAHLALSHASTCTESACATGCPVRALDGQGIRASRLFFCAKATKSEREAGCEALPLQSAQLYTGKARPARMRRNIHPTVKPVELMRWLVRLITPPEGVVLDPFAGSASTGVASVLENRRFLGIEREGRYVDIATARLAHWAKEAR